MDENDELHKSDEAFMSDAAATIIGAALGTSTTTTYIESVSRCRRRWKDRITAVTVGVLMLTGLFFEDYSSQSQQFAAAMALVVIGAMMMKQAADIDWADSDMAIPAFLTMVLMPFTYSIADGIAWGVISYCAIKLMQGKHNEVNHGNVDNSYS